MFNLKKVVLLVGLYNGFHNRTYGYIIEPVENDLEYKKEIAISRIVELWNHEVS